MWSGWWSTRSLARLILDSLIYPPLVSTRPTSEISTVNMCYVNCLIYYDPDIDIFWFCQENSYSPRVSFREEGVHLS